jgi:murein L,D-transpeptidase YcbB/YkuD
MGTGTKIAIGCGIALLLAGVAALVGLGAGAFWLKGKAEQAAGGLSGFGAKAQEIDKWQKVADANPFTAPANGEIQEAQLKSFLDVRKQVYVVYQQHKPELESLHERTKGRKTLTLGETLEAGSTLASLAADIRLVQAKALAGFKMSEQEYRYIQIAVYKSAWATTTAPLPEIAKGVEQGGDKGAQDEEDDTRQAREAVAQLRQGMKQLDVPQANIELFRRYQADIDRYAMHGLAVLGL